MKRALALAAAATALLASGCTDTPAPPPPGADPPGAAAAAPAAATATTSAAPAVVYDWAAERPVAAPGGWTVGPCEGDAPLVCVRRGDVVVAAEVSRLPLDSIEVLKPLRAEGASADALLRAHGEDYLEVFRRDRTKGCGAGFVYTPEEVVVADGVVRTGFRGRAATGAEERSLRWAAIRGDELVGLTTSAQDPNGCLGTEGQPTTAAFDAALPVLEALVRGSSLPR